MNYEDALNFIHGSKKFGSKLGLDNISKLLELLENPQDSLDIIHIAGTNGKGSTASYIMNILKEEGYRAGFFTSPYLETFTERIRINNNQIQEHRLCQITKLVKEKVEYMLNHGYNHPTEFEIVTAIGFKYFEEENVDFVVLEVGLGGRFDATNVVNKTLASVITSISYDHVDILGDNLSQIAREKAGIIKEDGLVFSYPQETEAKESIVEVVKNKKAEYFDFSCEDVNIIESTKCGSKFDFKTKEFEYADLHINLLGEHQIYNAALSVMVMETLRQKGLIKLSKEAIINGINNTSWNGRLEQISEKPDFIIDGAHNLNAAIELRKTIINLFSDKRLVLGIGMLKDKDVDGCIDLLVPLADEIVVTEAPLLPRAMKAEDLADKIIKYNKETHIEKDIEKAVKKALEVANEDDLIIFSGSLYIIGDVRRIVKDNK
ncbi:bifunctional folylpolyglutamate synthase/dihydrofolate synthase [Abyssisolibacter fermentans]|uniref:bifunctional folylpolyglutamate synthase/dihydrofolate synthase n=1 Tax=Abyssisolibacter fermentans TaxID=1766203 RepID=UPI00082D59F8|nr:folylpolyglutamate synthase/dihydrofolate synthase family protein [Abyssisolibacter fermentans]